VVRLQAVDMPNFSRDVAEKRRADGAMRVAHRVGELHLLAVLEEAARPDDLRVELSGTSLRMLRDGEAALAGRRVDLGEDRVEVEIVEMGTAA
jgi:hypothetical protein